MLQVEHVQRENLSCTRGDAVLGAVTSTKHLYLADFITEGALEMRDFFEIHIEAELRRKDWVECVDMLKVEVEVPGEFANTTTNVYRVPKASDERLA